MPRTRDLKPGFFKNEELAECEPLARLLFQGLWVIADREGRLEDRPKKIKTEILPYDDCDMESLLSQLARFNFIIRYESEGKKYIWIPTFKTNQRFHPKESPSVIPAYEPRKGDTQTVTGDNPGNTQTVAKSTKPSFPSFPSLPTRKSPQKISFSAADVAVADFIIEKIKTLDPTFKPKNRDAWANEIRLMVEQDKRSHDSIKELYDWVSSDHFWRKNVLSPSKLREKWTQLSIAKSNPTKSKPVGTQISATQIVPAEQRQGGSGPL